MNEIARMNIGYVGIGAMGSALARRLVGSHRLTVWDLNRGATAALKELGASVATTAAELARECDIVFLCLPRSSDVRQLLFGAGGLAEGLSPGKLVIDQTSGVPGETLAMANELAARGIDMIDAPVSGGVSGAAAGTITIMASGPAGPYERALPVMSVISPNVIRCGSRVGDGQAMKLVNNLLSAGKRVATLEVVAMGRKMGLSLATITDLLNKGSGRNRTSRVFLQNLVDRKPSTARFAMSLMLKDLNQAIQLGMDVGVPTELTNLTRGLLQIGVNTLGESAQLDQVVNVIESLAGTRIADPIDEVAGTAPAAKNAAAKPEALKIGYVGLGVMGGALVRRLRLSHEVEVFDANKDLLQTFESAGTKGATDLPSLARHCDVIFICVPTSEIVRNVIFGKAGLAEGLSSGKIIIDQTTGDPSITRSIAAELKELGVALIDAPVAGGPRGAGAGTIAVMCGGDPDAYAAVRPILESISPNLVHCGQIGNGHLGKLINAAVASANRLLTYEAASIGVKFGLKLKDMDTVINSSTGSSSASERILPALSNGKASADFQLQLMLKDLKLAGRTAIECGAPLLVGTTVRSMFQTGVHTLGPTENLDSMARLFEATGGVTFSGA